MALLTDLATLKFSCFNRDEIEMMLQWRTLQKGDFVDVEHGTYGHLYERERRMHWLYYVEDQKENEQEMLWRLDLHYDAGQEACYKASIDHPLEDYFKDTEARFNLTMPVVLKGSEDMPILVEMVNKNMLDNRYELGSEFELNMNFSVVDLELFSSRKEWQAGLPEQEANAEIKEVMPFGVMVDQMRINGEKISDDVIQLFKNVMTEIRINPVELVNMVGEVIKVDEINLGNDVMLYDLTVKNNCGQFHMPVPSVFIEAEDIEPGVFVSALGFFSALYLNDCTKIEEAEDVILH